MIRGENGKIVGGLGDEVGADFFCLGTKRVHLRLFSGSGSPRIPGAIETVVEAIQAAENDVLNSTEENWGLFFTVL